VVFLAADGSRAGEVVLGADPLVPEAVLDALGIGDGWLLAADFSWAVRADHDGIAPVEFFDVVDGAG
jgi:hypothetical protein